MQRAYANGRPLALLTPQEMSEADRLAIRQGPYGSYRLMCNAGQAVAAEVLRRFPQAHAFDVLCGPGNNGGDGYVVAQLLHAAGSKVRVWATATPREGSDAAIAASDCMAPVHPLADFVPQAGSVVVDALFGAGLARGLDGAAAAAAIACCNAGVCVVAVDLPSGVSGESGKAVGASFKAALTVTFFCRKPGHLLEPGRSLCGETVVVDIGIPVDVLDRIAPKTCVNHPGLWLELLPRPDAAQHKYSRGAAAVFTGGIMSTGAGRLAATAAARIGAGAVTVYSPASAVAANAAHLTSIMLRKVDDEEDLREAIRARAPDALVLGPGFGHSRPLAAMAMTLFRHMETGTLVLDADGITAFRERADELFRAAKTSALKLVLTPHDGEFARLFPDLAADEDQSRLTRARRAAERSGGVIVCKGPDTVIASPDGRAAINANGSPWLATAGSGDVLAGLISGLAAQRMPPFEAACAAIWIHADAAARFGPGLIAEDLPGLVPGVLRDLIDGL